MLNHVTIVGYVGGNPEMKYTAAGEPVCSFNVATTSNYTNKNGEKESITEWHKCVAYKKTATICNDYVHKGKLVLVEGSLKTNKWENESGARFQSTQIVIKNILFLDKERQKNGNGDYQYSPSLDAAVDKAMADAYGPKSNMDEIPF